MLSPEVLAPETTELRQEALTLVDRAKAITVATNDEYTAAGRELVRVANVRKSIVTAFKEPKEKAFQAHRAITKLESDLLAIPAEAERVLKSAMGVYKAEEDKRRREAEARAQEALRKQLEDDRITEAEALAETGHQAEAEALLDAPVVAPVVQLERPVAAGVSTRRKWGFRIIDPKAINREFLIPDEKKIRQTVTALGPDAAGLIGGIEITEEQIVAVRTSL